MGITNVFGNNRILCKISYIFLIKKFPKKIIFFSAEATNLFLRENGHEVLKAMQPQLQKKLSVEFSGIANQLLKHVPIEKFLVD